jgi:SAM-dependent methyltransferase
VHEDDYRINAIYYDGAYDSVEALVDVPFYVEEAKRAGGPVLELGCGTGRVSREIARTGIDVVGIDSSPSMLEIFRQHLGDEDAALADRIRLRDGDLRTVDLERTFPLVILPFRVLQHMYTLDDQKRAFATIARHMDAESVALFDVFFPRFERVYSGIGEVDDQMEWRTADGKRIERTFIKDSIDKIEQSFAGRFIYRTYEGEELEKEETTSLKMVCYTPPQLRLLCELTGLEVAETFGSFARVPLDNEASNIIFRLGKK